MAEGLSVAIRTKVGDHFDLDMRFDAPPGITVLFGPSGSGKSSTLAAIAGLYRPEEGRIALGSDVWFDSKRGVDRAVHLRGVAFVFQSLALFPHMTALANVEYGIDRNKPRATRIDEARKTLDRMRVAHLAHRKPRTFSGGEAQRVALARAFAMSPKLVLLDEPFTALDRDLRRELCADVKSAVVDLGIVAVLVTHHRNEARYLGDRLLLVREGKIAGGGDPIAMLPESEAPSGPIPRDQQLDFDETPFEHVKELP